MREVRLFATIGNAGHSARFSGRLFLKVETAAHGRVGADLAVGNGDVGRVEDIELPSTALDLDNLLGALGIILGGTVSGS